ncbi:MAG: prohibitin family protein [Deltaproteobacteria bacterium]|nr:prohibitin family protein [Deltaproteobacteria bacterium]
MGSAARLFILLVVATSASGCGKTIDSGHRGVYYNWRKGTDIKNVLGEGFHWLAPWNKIMPYDVRTKDRVERLVMLSKDQLQIRCDVSIRYALASSRVAELHAKVGPEFYQMLIQPVLRNATRDVVSRYESIDAYRSRSKIEEAINKRINETLAQYHYFSVDRVMLRRMEFPKVVVAAIERKLAMKQEAEREKFSLEKAKIVAQRKLVEAEATAKAQAILKAELNDALLRWKGIEATLSLAESNNTKVVIVGAGKSGLPLILGGDAK